MHSALRAARARPSRRRRSPAREMRSPHPVLGDRRSHRRALGPVAEDLPAQPRDALGRERDRRRPPAAPASPGSGAPRTARRGSAGRGRRGAHGAGVRARAAPSPRRAAPPRAGARACSREKQNARWGTRAHSALHERRRTRPPAAPEVLAPVGAAPHLEPVDHQLVAHQRAQPPPRRAARSRGTRTCAPRRSGGRGAAGARARRARRRSGGRIRRRPLAV